MQLSRNHQYVDYYVSLFQNYRVTALASDLKAKEQYLKSDLQVFLEKHTVVHTLELLWERLNKHITQRIISLPRAYRAPNQQPKLKADFVSAISDVIMKMILTNGQPVDKEKWLDKVKEICDGNLLR